MNSAANTIVIMIPKIVPRRFPSIKEWCAYVTLAPDDKSRIVLSNGISKGFKGSIPTGGQAVPNSTVGARAEWKYAQKILIKKNTSLTMNNATPRLRPFWTAKVWLPISVPSATTSRNHKIIALTVATNPNSKSVADEATPLK